MKTLGLLLLLAFNISLLVMTLSDFFLFVFAMIWTIGSTYFYGHYFVTMYEDV